MPLGFVGDAISLSGLTGTKLKCDVIGEYYKFLWSITSGGPRRNHRFSTAIVELNAATGEVYIKDTKEIVLGSAGHALELKMNTPQTENLKVVLIEEHPDCYAHLKNVIERRWPDVPIEDAEGPISSNTSNIYLLNMNLNDTLEKIEEIKLGKTSPDNASAFGRFKRLHSELFRGLSGRKRPLQWRILWTIIKNHEEGICDYACRDFKDIKRSIKGRQRLLGWLEEKEYLIPFDIKNAWSSSIKQYRLNWAVLKKKLGVDPPPPLKSLSPGEI